MIRIQQSAVDSSLFGPSSLSKSQEKIFEALLKSPETYVYQNKHQLLFEIVLRDRIIHSAVALAKSKVRFAIFRFSKCNEQFWIRNELGGFQLRKEVLPADAINDIFVNSHLYAFECATAIVIVFYKAVLDVIDQQTFNTLFSNLLLYDWHVDRDLGIKTKKGEDYLPGDCLYFKNPEFDPQTPQWQGENTIYLGDDLHYGHGIGVTTTAGIIAALNRKRKKFATKSAYLVPQTTRVDFAYLSKFASNLEHHRLPMNNEYLITGTLGSATFLYW
ncbi:protein-glutamine gamma-glutamyltransferase [Saccharococcus caldoxylosilyticus]|jgi:protein-glutamine gamma-glutamyltransferase|uniref:protein-glutamine gamma-glutamyltransferase n=1 Tax=Saccharococcus caldoxylosilyticus TaxID=81408 RepID=UPI0003052858|nr:protein-glutamine gamma-glutamyltransferase [Parageobacillus caldoxylosilyticus]OQP04949.1 protein-glutamine gamma-glutamyltransferase [Geobacillus sp. 44B]QNU39199.1 protein-glutamine gamma-glutamyltransferase [Geobacillus sp. 44B]QXJ39052.1 Protein-glutamine gamma-glutamyltransferase [Parageobacillus caldoxylosilyticus]BDG37258.1 protein-glutamine gamma-glutamyltransferase [Parageobacillus caldoxylosilyticus]BDG41049.1 protein-glutamine gamma-glutamyltransferase [Parageobacillus caldoxylo